MTPHQAVVTLGVAFIFGAVAFLIGALVSPFIASVAGTVGVLGGAWIGSTYAMNRRDA